MDLTQLGINPEVVYALFGGEDEYNNWFKSAVKEELERRQLQAAREAANAVMQNTQITIPEGL